MFKKFSLTLTTLVLLVILTAPSFAVITPLPTRRPTGQVKGLTMSTKEATSLVSPNGNVYVANDDVTITERVRGDLVAAGNNVVVTGRISGNVFVAAGGVQIDGDVNGDLTAAGGSVIVNGTVRGDVRVAGGEVFINSDNIGGDMLIAAGKTSIAKGVKVGGLDQIAGESGSKMNVVRDSTTNPTELSQTQLASTRPAREASGAATIVGIVIGVFFSLTLFLGSIIAAYLVLRLFPTFSETTLVEMKKNPLKSILIGWVSGFVFFIIVILLAVSVVGWPVLALGGLIAVVAYYIAGFYASYSVGRFILTQLKHTHTGRLFPLVIGMVLVGFVSWFLEFIPFIGWLINSCMMTILVSWGVGAMLVNKYHALKKA